MAEKQAWPTPVDPYTYRDDSSINKNLFHVDYLRNNFRDFARSNLFKVEFTLPNTTLKFLDKDVIQKVEMTAKSINIPAYDMLKQEVKRMGQRVILPATMNTGECQVTFISDDEYKQRKFLHSWFHNLIYNYETNVYRPVMSGADGCVIRIFQLDNKFNVIFGIQLDNCWPSSVGEIQLSQDSENQIAEFPASFAYSTYKIMTPEADNM